MDGTLAGSARLPRGVGLAAAPLSKAQGLPQDWLGSAERERAEAYDDGAPRRRFVAGRLLVRELVVPLLAAAGPGAQVRDPGGLELHHECPNCGSGAHGRPWLHAGGGRLPEPVSYSRAGGWVAAAVGPAGSRLGVDLVLVDDTAFLEGPEGNPLDDVVFAPGEQELLSGTAPGARPGERARMWALKEALGKALGEGIAGADGPPTVDGPLRHPALPGAGVWAGPVRAVVPGAPPQLFAAVVLLPS